MRVGVVTLRRDAETIVEVTDPMLPRKSQQRVDTVPVPQTNTGGRVENTKAIGRTMVKELGKLHP
jgi:hypothetical protein